MINSMRLTILGSGMPTPAVERFGTSFVIGIGYENIMFDCGPATTHKLAKAGLSPLEISHLFFTHHHFDHNVDYPCLLLSRWDQDAGQTEQLRVFGPRGTEQLTDRLIGTEGAFVGDLTARIHHPLSQQVFEERGGTLPRKPPMVLVTDLEPGNVIRSGAWSVVVGESDHVQPYLDCLAYRFEGNGVSVAFPGDSLPSSQIISFISGVDVVLYECWDDLSALHGFDGRSGPTLAGELAAESDAKALVVVHRGTTLSSSEAVEQAREEISEAFPGQILFAEELMTVELLPNSQKPLRLATTAVPSI